MMSRLWPLFLALCLLAAPACHSDEDETVRGEMTLYETFDSIEVVQDHDGVLYDEDDPEAFATGLVGGAYWLGDDNYIRFPSAGVVSSHSGTIEFWMLIKDNWHDGTERQIMHLNGPGNFAIFKDGVSDSLAFAVQGQTVIRAEHGQYVGWNAWPQWSSRWTHVAVTWDHLSNDEDAEDGEMVLYVDGVAQNQYVGHLPEIDISGNLILGTWEADRDANILIDELRIYRYAKPYWEFEDYDAGLPERELPYNLEVWPTPHGLGMRPEAGFTINPDTKIIVADEDYANLEDALGELQRVCREAYGFAPDLGPAGQFFGEDNFIAIGEPTKNGLVETVGEKTKLPVRLENPGPGGYLLEVYEQGIVVAGSDYAGTVHGLMSLMQILKQHQDGYVPAITMVDYPDFAVRAAEWPAVGLLLNDEAKRRIRYFAGLKLSHLLIRTPDYLLLDDESTALRITEFFAFARRYGLEPVPVLDMISHAETVNAICDERGVDCRAAGDYTHYCPCEPQVYEVIDPALENIVALLQPSVVHLGHDSITHIDDDKRCAATQLSNAELFAQDVNHAIDLLHGLDGTLEIWMWADMINPLHHGSVLREPADYEGAPEPPQPQTLLPTSLVYNLWYYAPTDTLSYIIALLSLRGFEDWLLPYYTAGPMGDDIESAVSWMRNAYDMNALGFVFRPRTAADGPGDLSDPGWDGLPAAEEYAWSLFVPEDVADVWYDYRTINRTYGGF